MIAPTREWILPYGLKRADFSSRRKARKAARQCNKFQFNFFWSVLALPRRLSVGLGGIRDHQDLLYRIAKSGKPMWQFVFPPRSRRVFTTDAPQVVPEEIKPLALPKEIFASKAPIAVIASRQERKFRRIMFAGISLVTPLWLFGMYEFYNYLTAHPSVAQTIYNLLMHRVP